MKWGQIRLGHVGRKARVSFQDDIVVGTIAERQNRYFVVQEEGGMTHSFIPEYDVEFLDEVG